MVQSMGNERSSLSAISVFGMAALMALSVVFSPAVAGADEEPTQEDGLQMLRTANDAFDDDDFETAYEHYAQAYEILGVPEIKYRMGQTAEKIEEVELAIDHYEAYREIGEDEEFLGRIDEALPELRAQQVATLEIVTDPQGAQISVVDAQGQRDEVGTSPQTIEREAGQVDIEFTLDDYQDHSVQRDLEAGAEYLVEVALELEESQDQEPQTVELTPEPLEDIEEESDYGTWGWTSAGLGASILAIGGVMSYFQFDATNQVNDFDRGQRLSEAEDDPAAWESARQEQEALRSDAMSYHRAAVGAYIAGGLLTAAGVGLLTFDAFRDDGTADGQGIVELQGGIAPGGGFFGVGGRF